MAFKKCALIVMLLPLLAILSGCSQYNATSVVMELADHQVACLIEPVPMATASFLVLLAAGLMTGLSHCVGMCGPLVGAFAMRRRAVQREISTPLVLFQLGRVSSYVIIGTIVGGVGQVLGVTIRDWQGLFSVAMGLLLAGVGLGLLGLLPLQRWIAAIAPAGWIMGRLKQLLASSHPAAPVALGLLNGLLPCGPVYAMALLAAVSGSPLKGAGFMFVFGLGTLPALLAVGFSISTLSLHLRTYLYRVSALLIIVVGVQLTLRGLALNGQIGHVTIGAVMLW